jgi:hypothetical protein
LAFTAITAGEIDGEAEAEAVAVGLGALAVSSVLQPTVPIAKMPDKTRKVEVLVEDFHMMSSSVRSERMGSCSSLISSPRGMSMINSPKSKSYFTFQNTSVLLLRLLCRDSKEGSPARNQLIGIQVA